MTYVIYHNPRCSKSRQTLGLLEAAGVDVEVVQYLDEPPTADRIAELAGMLDMAPGTLVRRKEALFSELGLGELADGEWCAILAEHPRLLERPIVVAGDRAVIGRPPENVRALL
jgi:arsenate reductase